MITAVTSKYKQRHEATANNSYDKRNATTYRLLISREKNKRSENNRIKTQQKITTNKKHRITSNINLKKQQIQYTQLQQKKTALNIRKQHLI